MTQLAVALQDVRKVFSPGSGQQLEVLNIPQWVLAEGSCTVLRGRSGSGKTTLLNLLAGITLPTTGRICISGTDIAALPEATRDRFRAQHIGYIFQTFNLLQPFTALENVQLAMRFTQTVPKHAQRQHARDLLVRLGLESRLTHKPAHLSRGEQQRVAMARALANQPPLLLADEPCASLDANTAQRTLNTLFTVCREAHTTLLMVSHEDTAGAAADQVLDLTTINHAVG